MRKLFILALLIVLGVATQVYAVSIPQSEKGDAGGPYVWYLPVYNNSTSDLDVGDVVIWDIDSADDDAQNYVNTTTTYCTGPVAGVVIGSSIGAKSTGMIAVHGVVDVDYSTTGRDPDIAVDDFLCTGESAGDALPCGQACGTSVIGYAVKTGASGTVKAFINVR